MYKRHILFILVLVVILPVAAITRAAPLGPGEDPAERQEATGSMGSISAARIDAPEAIACGTVESPEQIAYALSFDRQAWLGARARSAATYYVPISFHVVRRSDGTGGLPRERLDVALRDLNQYFDQAGIRFFRFRSLGAFVIDYIDNDSYYYNTNTQAMRDLLRQENPVPNTMNVWIAPFTGISQSTFTNKPIQGIIMGSAATGLSENPTTLAHEVGHYLDLLHTHAKGAGYECPDGTNCATAGDLMCDTPADPNLTGKVSDCVYTGTDTLPTGCSGVYNPSADNLMSYAPKRCRSAFTTEQIDKMVTTLTTIRTDLFQFDSTDIDGDGIADVADVCPVAADPGQEDADGDFWGDACDDCASDSLNDIDGDGICGNEDNCPFVSNFDQVDSDGNGVGDACACEGGLYGWTGASSQDEFGWRTRGAGDVDGDGTDDIIVGAQLGDANGTNSGQVYVYSGADGSALYVFTGEAEGDRLGFSVNGAGDVNKDGFDDMIAGAWQYGGGTNAGRAYLFYGGTGPFPQVINASAADMIFTGNPGDQLGISVGAVDDANGDTYRDLIVGANQEGNDGPGGYANIYSGQTGVLIRTLPSEAPGDGFGYAVAAAGDVNNDGNPDVIVGALQGNYAKVFSAADGTELHRFAGEASGDGMGGAVAGVGRVDDDDFDDVIVGAPWNDAAGNSSGRAYVYSGQTGSEIYRFTGSERGDQCGWAVDGIGDYNGDGYNDVVIGAPRNDASADRKGMVYVCSGEDGSVLQTFEGSAAGERFGRDVSGVADIDNDGVRDLIVGAWGHSTTAYQAGGVFAYSLGACEICPIAVDGDVNESGAVTSADIIHLVGYVFKGDVAPLPCDANGDVDCSDAVTSADIIYLVNFVFKGGPPPCDICSDSPMLCILFEVSSGRRPG